MDNILEYGTDWNLYANLRAFKNGEQNEAKTALNIRLLFKHEDECKRSRTNLNFEAELERQNLQLKND